MGQSAGRSLKNALTQVRYKASIDLSGPREVEERSDVVAIGPLECGNVGATPCRRFDEVGAPQEHAKCPGDDDDSHNILPSQPAMGLRGTTGRW